MSVSESRSLSTITRSVIPRGQPCCVRHHKNMHLAGTIEPAHTSFFVGGEQETAVHVFASTCTDRCPLLALSGQSMPPINVRFRGKSGHRKS